MNRVGSNFWDIEPPRSNSRRRTAPGRLGAAWDSAPPDFSFRICGGSPFFARGRGAQAFWNDFVWAAVLFPSAALLLASGKPSMQALMVVWAVAGLTAAAVGLAQTRVVPQPTIWVAPRATQSGLSLLRRVRRIDRREPAVALPDRRSDDAGRSRTVESRPDDTRPTECPLPGRRARRGSRDEEIPSEISQEDGRGGPHRFRAPDVWYPQLDDGRIAATRTHRRGGDEQELGGRSRSSGTPCHRRGGLCPVLRTDDGSASACGGAVKPQGQDVGCHFDRCAQRHGRIGCRYNRSRVGLCDCGLPQGCELGVAFQ